MKITAIKQQLKNPERVSVFIDGKYEFSLSLDELVREKLKKEQNLSPADLKKYKKMSEDGKLRSRSLEWLLGRPHSTREFRDYLRKKRAETDLTDKLIAEFNSKGYLDDAKFAEWFTQMRARKFKSRRSIKAELAGKGISGELAEKALLKEAIDEETAIREIINKKQKQSRYQNDPIKLTRYLTSQGFSYDLVKKALNNNSDL